MADFLYSVGFTLDDKALSSSLAGIQSEIQSALSPQNALKSEIGAAVSEAKNLEVALRRATSDKGISYNTLQQELRRCGTSATQLTATLSAGGSQFAASLNAANIALATANRSTITLGSRLKEMARVMTQSFKYSAAQRAIQAVANEIKQTVSWVKDLNTSVNAIAVVTGKSADEIAKITQSSIQAAKDLRVAAREYTDAALIFYQQGLSDEEVARRTDITIKAAKAAGQSVDEMSQQLTAIWNTYGMIGDEQARAASVGAKLAAATAADFADIAEAMQYAASAASQMGVSYNSLASIIATVKDTTQQSASIIGNAYKTIFSRFEQLKSAGTDGEVTLNRVSQQLQDLGINILGPTGELRKLDDVITEVGNNWNNYTQKQQLAIAETVGGTRQYSQFLALMQNFDKYQKNLQIAQNETGAETLEQQYEQAIDSIEAMATRSTEAWRRAWSTMIPDDFLKKVYESSEKIGETWGSILKGIGGLPGILNTVGIFLMSKISPAVSNLAQNSITFAQNITHSGRVRGINKDYDIQRNDVNYRIGLSEKGSDREYALQTQGAKVDFGREVALQNEEINTLERRGRLISEQAEMQRQRLTAAQEEYQINLDLVRTEGQRAQEAAALSAKGQGVGSQLSNEFATIIQSVNEFAMAAPGKTEAATDQMAAAFKNLSAYLGGFTNNEAVLRTFVQEYDQAGNEIEMSSEEAKTKIDTVRSAIIDLQEQAAQYAADDSMLSKTQQISQMSATVQTLLQQLSVINPNLSNSLYNMLAGADSASAARSAVIVPKGEPAVDTTQQTQQVEQTTAAFERLKVVAGETKIVLKQVGDASPSGLALSAEKLKETMAQAAPLAKEFFDALKSGDTSKVFGDLKLTQEQISSLIQSFGKLQTAAENNNMAGFKGNLNNIINILAKTPNGEFFTKLQDYCHQTGLTAEELRQKLEQMMSGSSGGTPTGGGGGGKKTPLPKEKPEITSKEVSDAIGGVTSLAFSVGMVVNSLTNVSQVLKDETSDWKQKLAAVAMAVGSIGSAVVQLGPAIKKIGVVLNSNPWIAVATAVLAALIAIMVHLKKINELKSPEGQLKAAKEAAEALKEAEEKATEAADALRSAFEKYNTAKEALDDCRKGTEEWEAALRAANDAALELVSNLPDDISAGQLEEVYQTNPETGEIEINTDALNELIEQADLAVSEAKIASAMAETQVARADLQASNFYRKSGDIFSIISDNIETLGERDQEEIYNLDDQMTQGSRILALVEDISKNLGFWAAAGDNLSTKLEETFERYGFGVDAVDSLVKELHPIAEQLKRGAEQVEARAAAQSRAAAELALGDDYGAIEKRYAAKKSDTAVEDALEELDKVIDDNSEALTDNLKQQIIDAVVKKYGYLGAADNFVRSAGEEYVFRTGDSGNRKKTISKTEIAELLATEDIIEQMGENAEAMRQALDQLSQSGVIDEIQHAITNYLTTGDMGDLTRAELGAAKEMSEGSFNNLPEEIKEMFNNSVEVYNRAVEASSKVIDEAAKGSVASISEAYGRINQNGTVGNALTANTAEQIVKALTEAYIQSGTEGMNNVASVIEKVAPEAFDEIYKAIDWAHPSVDRLTTLLREEGKMTEGAAKAAELLVEALKRQEEVTLESAQADYAAMTKIVKSLTDSGIIDPEAFKQLEELGIAADSYFTQMADGTYMLTEDASEFKNMVQQIGIGKLYEAANQSLERYQMLEDYADYTDADLVNVNSNDRIKLLQGMGYNDPETLTVIRQFQEINGDPSKAVADLINTYTDANISPDSIKNTLLELSQEITKAQEAISLTNFQNAVEEYGLNLEETAGYAEYLAEELGITEAQARKLAIANERLDRGCKDLNDNFDDYKDALVKTNKGTADYVKTLKTFKSSLADVLNVSEDILSNDFAEQQVENSELLEKAISGDTEALTELKKSAAINIGDNFISDFEKSAENLGDKFVGTDAFKELQDNIALADSAWNTLKAGIEGGIGNMSVESFQNAMNTLVQKAGMTYEQVTSLFGAMGVDADVETKNITDTRFIPTTIEHKKQYDTVPTWWIDSLGVQHNVETPVFKTWVTQGDSMPVTGSFPTYSVKVRSGDKSSGGDIDVKSSLSQARAIIAPRASLGATTKKSSGGGGGSKSKASYHERYTDVENAINKTTKAMDRYRKAADDAFGTKKIANLEAYKKKLGQIAGLLKQEYEEARNYLGLDQVDLDSKIAKYGGPKAIYDEWGNLTNLEELQKYWEETVNASLDDETIKEHAEEIKEALGKFQESMDKLQDVFDQMIEGIRNYVAAELEQISSKVDVNIKIKETDTNRLETIVTLLGNVGLKTGKTLDALISKENNIFDQFNTHLSGANETIDLLKSYQDPVKAEEFKEKFGERAYEAWATGNGKVPAEALEYLTEMRDSVLDDLNSYHEESEAILHSVIDMLQAYLDDFDKIASTLENNQQTIDTLTSILENSPLSATVSGRSSALKLAQAARNNVETQLTNTIAQRNLAKQAVDGYQNALDDFFKEAGTAEIEKLDFAQQTVYNNLKDSLDEATSTYNELISQTASDMKSAIEAAVAELQAAKELAKAELVEILGGNTFTSFEAFGNIFDQNKELKNFFLDAYEKEYAISDLEAQIAEQIKDINDPSRLAAWGEFQDKLNEKRAEGVNLTRDDIELLQAEFELQKLYDQYEEAKNAKNTMRLVRDASGNYSYVYSNDQENIDELERNIKEQKYNIYEMHKNIEQDAEETWAKLRQQEIEYIEQIDEDRYQRDTVYAAEVDANLKYYEQMAQSYADIINEHTQMIGIQFSDTALGVATACISMDEAQKTWTDNIVGGGGYFEQVKKAGSDFITHLNGIGEQFDTTLNNLNGKISKEVQKMIDKNDELKTSITDAKKAAENALTGALTTLNQKVPSIVTRIGEMKTAYDELTASIRYYQDLADQNTKTEAEVNPENAITEGKTPSIDADAGKDTPPDSPSTGSPLSKTYTQKYETNARIKYNGVDSFILSFDKYTGTYTVAPLDHSRRIFTNIAESSISTMSTGGYTGEFKGGKLGILHEKELVLNATDTENVLAAVKAIRGSVFAQSAQLRSAVINRADNIKVAAGSTPVAQDVKIAATFPNVSVAAEIEEALNNIVNEAVQYVSSKDKE